MYKRKEIVFLSSRLAGQRKPHTVQLRLASMCALILLFVVPLASSSPFARHDSQLPLTNRDIFDFPSLTFGSS